MQDFQTDPRYARAREALSVTGLPTLSVNVADRPVDTEHYLNPKVSGEYDPKTNTMWTRDTEKAVTPDSHLGAVHEYGHAIWFQGFDRPLIHRGIDNVLQVIARTNNVGRLVGESELAARYMDANNLKVLGYLLTPTEIFARAVAQYVFTTAPQSIQNKVDWLLWSNQDYENYSIAQWTEDDFAPVIDAFDQNFNYGG